MSPRHFPLAPGIFRVVETGTTPVIDGGLAEKGGGQIGTGILRAPLECFTAAVATYREAIASVDEAEETGILP